MVLALALAGCGPAGDGAGVPPRLARALERLRAETGAEVGLQLGDSGATRVLTLSPRAAPAGASADPADAALRFLRDHRDAFGLEAAEAGDFEVARVDRDPRSDVRHVTLQRLAGGDPVFQGAITVHLSRENSVFSALGDDHYRATPPTNRRRLTAPEAARAAARALGLGELEVEVVSSGPRRTVLASRRLADEAHVTPVVVQVSPAESRYASQVTLSWGASAGLRYRLALVDAETGALLRDLDLMNDFSGRVFTASPGAAPASDDGRVVVPFDGDPTASPLGWVASAGKTAGNNVVAATDLDGDNRLTSTEVQPAADAGVFDFPFSAAQDAAAAREAAVTNAFFLANDWHDRAYALGFTESAGNFQTSNLGRGGAQNDEVQVDVQDAKVSNNANFATPPDGQRPRLQLGLFDLAAGPTLRRDGAFDPTVIHHELTHGLSNRLVGGGSTACLGDLQSGGLGEGWSDFLAASFLDDPVIGAYVTGNATTGIRLASMASSTFTYADIKNRTLAEVHDVGELWAATLWGLRTALGQATTEALVVAGMKLTPCNPTMLHARDAILQADVNLDGGAHRCLLWRGFARRGMGEGASSPNASSTSAITTSREVPADCQEVTATFGATDLPLAIPDASPRGVRSQLTVVPAAPHLERVLVNVHVTHSYRGDLVIELVSPGGETATLSSREGGSADDYLATDLDLTGAFTPGSRVGGTWQLRVRDLAAQDTGTIDAFGLTITSTW